MLDCAVQLARRAPALATRLLGLAACCLPRRLLLLLLGLLRLRHHGRHVQVHGPGDHHLDQAVQDLREGDSEGGEGTWLTQAASLHTSRDLPRRDTMPTLPAFRTDTTHHGVQLLSRSPPRPRSRRAVGRPTPRRANLAVALVLLGRVGVLAALLLVLVLVLLVLVLLACGVILGAARGQRGP